jgi:hypothetical protein
VVEDHTAGGADAAGVGVEAGHGLLGAERASDLPFNEAEHRQGQADDLDEGGDTPVVLHEDRRGRERPLEVVVAAFDHALALVVDQDLAGVGFLGRDAGQQRRVPTVDRALCFQDVLVEVPGQGGVPGSFSVMVQRRQEVTRRLAVITPIRATIFSRVL